MAKLKKIFISLLCFLVFLLSPCTTKVSEASSGFAFIILTKYSASMNIGEELYVSAITSNFSLPSWKSSNSSVASVNTYGKVTAKKAGSAVITAKIKNAEASCKITVHKTSITLSKTTASMERGSSLILAAVTSNNSLVTWKSSKSSVAAIDDKGVITALKPGETTITATADNTKVTCKVTVKKPTIKLSQTKLKMYRGNTFMLTAKVSSGISPVWKTNKKSVAIVDENGLVTAVKNGTAIISATVDGVEKRCEIVVEKPDIELSVTELYLKKGDTAALTAKVSSGNLPFWSTSNINVATVSETGTVTAVKKGRAYIYATEDGVKVRCTINVTD